MTIHLHPVRQRLETAAAEVPGETVLQGRAMTAHSPETMERDVGETWTWRCQKSVVHCWMESGKVTKVT